MYILFTCSTKTETSIRSYTEGFTVGFDMTVGVRVGGITDGILVKIIGDCDATGILYTRMMNNC